MTFLSSSRPLYNLQLFEPVCVRARMCGCLYCVCGRSADCGVASPLRPLVHTAGWPATSPVHWATVFLPATIAIGAVAVGNEHATAGRRVGDKCTWAILGARRRVLCLPSAPEVAAGEKVVFAQNLKRRYEVAGKALNVAAVSKSTVKMLSSLPARTKAHLMGCRNYSFSLKRKARLFSRLCPGRVRRYRTQVVLLEMDTLKAAVGLSLKYGCGACAMNLANQDDVGGRWTQIKGSQEECLMRNSSLFLSLWPRRRKLDLRMHGKFPRAQNLFFPMAQAGCLYSPNVAVTREICPDSGCSGRLLPPSHWPCVSVVSASAQDLRWHEYSPALTGEKLRSMMWTAAREGEEVLVLGAFGCGAFKNNPENIAKIYRSLLENEFRGVFRCVCFGIIKSKANLSAFSKEFGIQAVSSVDDIKLVI